MTSDRNPWGDYPPPAAHLSDLARQFFLHNFCRAERDAMRPPDPDDLDGWRRYNREALAARQDYNAEWIRRYPCQRITARLGGVGVLDIRPPGWAGGNKLLVYVHGGGFVGGAAADALDSTLPMAVESGLRIVSIDYTLAPQARHDRIATEVGTVLQALRAQGHAAADIAVYGDSAGATIATAALLQLRDRDEPLPAALALWSPWADLSCAGDSYQTLAAAEPFYTQPNMLDTVARCYAGPTPRDHPSVSVLFADYQRGFLPTLIQAGTRELMLSDAIRLHRRLLDAGVKSTLDLNDGLWHVFQFKPVDAPEATAARRRTLDFLQFHLGLS